MAKLLKAAHIVLVLLMLLYSGLVIEQFVVKLLDPGNQSLRFWKPGSEVGVIAVAFVALLGILAHSTGLLKVRSSLVPVALHLTWLACLTWFGWFSSYAPFRIQELVRVDLSDATAVRRAESVHLMQAVAMYLAIAVLVGLPIILRWYRKGDGQSAGNRPTVLQH